MPTVEVLRKSVRSFLQVAALFCLVAVVSACEYPNDAVVVENDSSRTLVLFEELGDNRLEVASLEPGHLHQTRKECVDGDFVVESEDGEELARRPGPFCQGEEPWVITDEILQEGG